MATNPYTPTDIASYNASPPPDRGIKPDDQVQWSYHTDKLHGPIKTLLESIDTNILAAFASLIFLDGAQNESLTISQQFYSSARATVFHLVQAMRKRISSIEGNFATLGANTFTAGPQIIKSGDAGTIAVDTGADELVLEGSGDAGLSIHTPDVNAAAIAFGADTTDDVAKITAEYNSGTERVIISTDGTTRLTIILGLQVGAPSSGDIEGAINAVGPIYEQGVTPADSAQFVAARSMWRLA